MGTHRRMKSMFRFVWGFTSHFRIFPSLGDDRSKHEMFLPLWLNRQHVKDIIFSLSNDSHTFICYWHKTFNLSFTIQLNVMYKFQTCCFVASIDMVTWCTRTRTLFSTVASICSWGTGKGAVISIISNRTCYKEQLVCNQYCVEITK